MINIENVSMKFNLGMEKNNSLKQTFINFLKFKKQKKNYFWALNDINIKIEKGEVDSIHLIYDEMSIRDHWLEHLDWLNNYLKVQTIKKLNFNKWFSLS